MSKHYSIKLLSKENLIKLYIDQNKSQKEIAYICGCSRTSVANKLKLFNINKKQNHRKYNAIDNFFTNWSHNMAYCLGFIAADGHVWKERPFFTVGIHKKDREVLEFIRDCVSPSSKVRESGDKVQICICSKLIWEDLKRYNVDHNKTFNLKIDYDIPEEYWGDFLRGFFDGDGCIFNSKIRGKNYYYTAFTSASKYMILYIQERLGFGVFKCYREKYYELRICQSESLKLFDIMYKEGHFCLKRKQNMFLEISTTYKKWTRPEDLIIEQNLDKGTKYIQDNLLPNRTRQAIQDRKNKIRKQNVIQ